VRHPKPNEEPAPIQEVLSDVLRGFRRASASPVGRVRKAWAEVVGQAFARRTRVTGLSNGQVTVEVSSAALKHDLVAFRAEEVLRGLRERLPDLGIRGVSYRVGAVS
jgi:predicted nucleic acid-binding Zn ribbon protein